MSIKKIFALMVLIGLFGLGLYMSGSNPLNRTCELAKEADISLSYSTCLPYSLNYTRNFISRGRDYPLSIELPFYLFDVKSNFISPTERLVEFYLPLNVRMNKGEEDLTVHVVASSSIPEGINNFLDWKKRTSLNKLSENTEYEVFEGYLGVLKYYIPHDTEKQYYIKCAVNCTLDRYVDGIGYEVSFPVYLKEHVQKIIDVVDLVVIDSVVIKATPNLSSPP